MSREALVLLVCCCDFRDGAERLIPSKSLRNAVIRAFPGLFCILRMCAPRRAAAVVRPRERKKSADRRRRILISRLLIIRASVPRRKSPFPAYFKGFPAVSPLIPPYPAFLKYPVSPHCLFGLVGLLTVTIGPDLSQLFIFTPTGEGFLAISSFCFAISFFFSKSITEEYDPILTGGWQMLIGGSLQMVVSFLLGGRLTFSAKGLLVVGYLIVLSCLAVTIWSILLKYNDPSQIAVFHLLTPIFGTLFSSVVLHEKTFNVQNLAALGMVCFGIFLVNFSRSKISPYI